jgi:hypothetical protein
MWRYASFLAVRRGVGSVQFSDRFLAVPLSGITVVYPEIRASNPVSDELMGRVVRAFPTEI